MPASAQRSRLTADRDGAMRNKIERFAHCVSGETTMPRLLLPARLRPRMVALRLLRCAARAHATAHAQDATGRAPLHRPMARQQRGANRILHGADRFRPLSAGQSRDPASRPRHGAARQGRPRRRAQRFRRSDQAQSGLRARLSPIAAACAWPSTIWTAPSPISTRRSSSMPTTPAPS